MKLNQFQLYAFMAIVITLLAAANSGKQNLKTGEAIVRTCEPIEMEMCKGLGYNFTGMPNLVGHDTQADAEFQLSTFQPLVSYNCHRQLRSFLCFVYAPMCTEKVLNPIGPCQTMCELVKLSCKPVLNNFGFPWPPALNCSKFPPKNDQSHMCMEGMQQAEGNKNTMKAIVNLTEEPKRERITPDADDINWLEIKPKENNIAQPPACKEFRHHEKYVYINRTGTCALRCDDSDIFSKDDRNFSQVWMSVWAGLCFAFTSLALLTFLIDSSRIRYPERVIVLLAMCYLLVSVAYIVRLIAGRETVACYCESSGDHVWILLREGLQNTSCTFVFLLSYYFSSASAVWWIILTFAWFLTAGLGWSAEAVERHSNVYHLLAWILSGAQTLVVLVLRYVDADELTGMCSVGYQDERNLLAFVITPSVIYLLVGTSLLLAGFVAFTRNRRSDQLSRPDGRQAAAAVSLVTDNVHQTAGELQQAISERLMTRIGLFSALYIIPVLAVLSCHLYEYINRRLWYTPKVSGSAGSGAGAGGGSHAPVVEVFMLKIFMTLVTGIVTGLWTCNASSVQSWKRFLRRVCGGAKNRQKPVQQQPQIYQQHSYQRRPNYHRPDIERQPQHVEPFKLLTSHTLPPVNNWNYTEPLISSARPSQHHSDERYSNFRNEFSL